jgi:hypothetical protein
MMDEWSDEDGVKCRAIMRVSGRAEKSDKAARAPSGGIPRSLSEHLKATIAPGMHLAIYTLRPCSSLRYHQPMETAEGTYTLFVHPG